MIGRIQTRNWEDDKGAKHYITEVIAEEVYFADSKKDGQEEQKADTNGYEFGSSDDLPF